MLREITILVSSALLLTGNPSAVGANPAEDLAQFLELYRGKFPQLQFDNYVYGALNFSADSRKQYDQIMDLPPFGDAIDQGKAMWDTPFANGKSYARCFPNEGNNIAGDYPRYDEKLDQVVTFEMALNGCRTTNDEPAFEYGDVKTMGTLTAYARMLSDGMKMDIKVDSPKAQKKYEAGKAFFFERRGQLNFACASCHMKYAGHILRTEILSPTIGQATDWPVFRGGERLVTLQARYQRCLEQMRAAPITPGSKDFNNLEYFHSYLSNGLRLKSSVYRK